MKHLFHINIILSIFMIQLVSSCSKVENFNYVIDDEFKYAARLEIYNDLQNRKISFFKRKDDQVFEKLFVKKMNIDEYDIVSIDISDHTIHTLVQENNQYYYVKRFYNGNDFIVNSFELNQIDFDRAKICTNYLLYLKDRTFRIMNLLNGEVMLETPVEHELDYKYILGIIDFKVVGDTFHILYRIAPPPHVSNPSYKPVYISAQRHDEGYEQINISDKPARGAKFVPPSMNIMYHYSEIDLNLFDVLTHETTYQQNTKKYFVHPPILFNEKYVVEIEKDKLLIYPISNPKLATTIENQFKVYDSAHFMQIQPFMMMYHLSKDSIIQFGYDYAKVLTVDQSNNFIWMDYLLD